MLINFILKIVWIHFVADFALQTTYMARNKSKSNKALGLHCLVYSIPFIIIDWKYAILAGLMHFPVDYITSRITSKLWEKGNVRLFFIVIGFDQAIHMTALLFAFKWLVLYGN